MSDLINRSSLIEIAEQQGYVNIDDILSVSTVEAAPVVHGHWDMFGCCNQCGYGDEKQDTQYIQENYKHCPNCGAKMDL